MLSNQSIYFGSGNSLLLTFSMSLLDDRKATKDYLVLETEDESLREKDLILLSELAGQDKQLHATSFQGIRRKLGLHQETLSRALKKLERDGFVQRIWNEYVLSEKGKSVISRTQRDHFPQAEESYPIPILRTILPPEANVELLERSLAHRWFGHLRWYGSTRSEDCSIFTWVTEDGRVSVSATMSNGYLSVEGRVISSESMTVAVKAAYEIFDHVSKGLRDSAKSPRKKLNEKIFQAA